MDPPSQITRVCVVNRGEIALRIQRACAKLNIDVVQVYTAVDATAPFVLKAPHAVLLGDSPTGYLDAALLLQVAKQHGTRHWFGLTKPWSRPLKMVIGHLIHCHCDSKPC